LNCNDKFVRTTNPQNVNDNGAIAIIGNFFGSKILKFLQIIKPKNVMRKWRHVNAILGNP
jgi:hypothetical protein